jgi:hypothetical protein
MGCLRQVGVSVLAAGLASLGCAAGSDPGGTTTTTTQTGEDTGVVLDEDGNVIEDTAVPGDDSAPVEDTAPPLTYPAGPYGRAVGSVIANFTWEGYRDGTGEWTKLSFLDYYDPDGKKGINAIKIGGAALW